tara:strand:- start:1005 stop:1607 length:603 start_codon:yes stop_codon:yes gene_type:complete
MSNLNINTKVITREQWLNLSSVEISKLFKLEGYEYPTDAKISCGWALGGQKVVGSCNNRISSEANVNEIFISPIVQDSLEALGILTHEMIHAIDDCEHGHRGIFVKMMKAIGLEGKPTSTRIGKELEPKLLAIIEQIGSYPHKKLNRATKKQGTRMLKMACSDCDWSFYASKKMIDRMVTNTCLDCGEDGTLQHIEPKKR